MPPDNHITSDSDLESVISSYERQKKPRRDSTGPKYFCSIEGCEEFFRRLDHLDRHEYKHTGIKKHACTYEGCDKSYSIVTHLKRHIRSTHERTAAHDTKTVPCSIKSCDKMFLNVTNMQKHIREVHENPKIYTCQYCNDKFTQRLKLRRHEVVQHTKEYPFKCDKCQRNFLLEYDLKRHQRVCKIYPCSDCSLEFHKWSAYMDHCKQTKHGRKYYKCEHCNRVFVKLGELQTHINSKHVDDEEKVVYSCPYENCERAYIYKKNLQQHVRSAHAGRSFKCTASSDCDSVFTSSQNLRMHLERYHDVDGKIKKQQPKKVPTGAERRRRKDAGSSKMSNLTKLSNVAVNRELDKKLRARELTALESAAQELVEAQNQSENDADESDAEMEVNDVVVPTENAENKAEGSQQEVPKEKELDIEILNLKDAVKCDLGGKLVDEEEAKCEKPQEELDALIAEVLTDD